MQNKRRRTRLSPKALKAKVISLAVASCFSAFVSTTVLANPTGPAVVSGSAIFNRQGNLLAINNSPGTIINWQGFSIAASEITRFIQQSAASSVLNRVVGVDPSVILGTLQSNGRVFLINPSGILFGAGAQIDVAGLVASTLNLSNDDFLAGRLRFTDTPGAGRLINQGAITTPSGGEVYLIAPNVQNTGIVTSPRGEIILASGRSVELVDAGTPNLRVEISAPDTAVVNVGQIIANSGKVGIYAGLIRNSGEIRADGMVVGSNGEILLKATQNVTLDRGSQITANGAHGGNITIQSGDTTLISGMVGAMGSEGVGGTVHVLGNRVGLMDDASINASGAAGGGNVLVGGDYQGQNAEVQNAFRGYVGPDATIRADALTSGDGGKVVVWSDDATRFYGTISAKGGAQSGNGGLVEVSGKGWLDFAGLVNTSAPNGLAGTLLLDPTTINIITGGIGTSSGTLTIGSNIFDSGAASSNLTTGDLINQLGLGNVRVTASSGGGGVGDINVNTLVNYTSTTSLTLTADHDINVIGNSIFNSGAGAINLIASNNVNIQNATVFTEGPMSVTARYNLNVIAGPTLTLLQSTGLQTISANSIKLQGGSVTNADAVLHSAGSQSVRATNITLIGGTAVGGEARALIRQFGAGGTQTINLSTGGTVSLQGGSGGASNYARILSEGVSQSINFAGAGAMTLTGGTGTSQNLALVDAVTGSQTIAGLPAITLIGGATGGVAGDGNSARIIADVGPQTISAGAISIVAGAGGVDNRAQIVIGASTQTITADGITLAGGGAAGTDNTAELSKFGTTGSQSITVNGGGSIAITGGSGAGGRNRAEIYNQGTEGQVISFGAGGSIGITGGTVGADNSAKIQTENGNQTITGATAISLAGGGSGVNNDAFISNGGGLSISAGSQSISVGSGGLSLTGGGGTASSNSAFIQQTGTSATQSITVNSGGNITLNGGAGSGNANNAQISASGIAQTMTFNAGGNINLTGGTVGNRNFARILANNAIVAAQTQAITGVTGITLVGGASGGGVDAINNGLGNFAIVQNSNGSQRISAGVGGITLTGGGGPLTNNTAQINQGTSGTVLASGTHQTITINGGGAITLQGGSSAQINVIGGVANPNNDARGSHAEMVSAGDAQQINFVNGGAINVTGGTVGSNNFASINSSFGTQTITGAPGITITGGASGGTQNGIFNVNEGNFARIRASIGNQDITASTINVTGGENGTNNSARIDVSGAGALQTISATGITLSGGADGAITNNSATSNHARIRSAGSQSLTAGSGGLSVRGGASFNFAEIRQTGPGLMDITTSGNIVVTGGSGGGFAQIYGNPDVNLTLTGATSEIQLNATTSSAYARIWGQSPSTIAVSFTARSDGGYFVNGQPVVGDAATRSGFFVGMPGLAVEAVLSSNLLVEYGIAGIAGIAKLPPTVVTALNTITSDVNSSTDFIIEQEQTMSATDDDPQSPQQKKKNEEKMNVCN